jgi:hypothetical protein
MATDLLFIYFIKNIKNVLVRFSWKEGLYNDHKCKSIPNGHETIENAHGNKILNNAVERNKTLTLI